MIPLLLATLFFPAVRSGSSPVIYDPPVNVTVARGDTATLECNAVGSPTPTVLIIKEDQFTDISEFLTDVTVSEDTEENDVRVMHQFGSVTEIDEGWYMCIAINQNGATSGRAYIDIVDDLCLKVECPANKHCKADYRAYTTSCECNVCEENTFEPVCASNCITYLNECQMKHRACVEGISLFVTAPGTCMASEPAAPEISVSSMDGSGTTVYEGTTATISCKSADPQVKLIKQKDGKTRVVNIGAQHVLSPVKLGHGATYRCQAKHCGQRTISEELQLKVISNAVLDPLEEIKTCKVFGEPHIITFDGRGYDFQGQCTYVLAMDCVNYSWFIYGQFMPCGEGVTCLEKVTLHMGSQSISLDRGWIVSVDGVKYRLIKKQRQTISGVDVEYTGLSVTVDAPNGVSMVYDGFWGIQITVPTKGATCGLCGNNNGDASDDFNRGRYGSTGGDSGKHAESWGIGAGCTVVEPAPSQCSQEEQRRHAETCDDMLTSSVFSKCMDDLGVTFYRESCIMDLCYADVPRYEGRTECALANTFAQHCERIGVKINKNFLDELQCGSRRGLQEDIYNAGCPLVGDPPFYK